MFLSLPGKLIFFLQEISPLKFFHGPLESVVPDLNAPSASLPHFVLEPLQSHRTVLPCLFILFPPSTFFLSTLNRTSWSINVKYIINTSYIRWARIYLPERFCVGSKWGLVKTAEWTTASFLFHQSTWTGRLIYFTWSSVQPSWHTMNRFNLKITLCSSFKIGVFSFVPFLIFSLTYTFSRYTCPWNHGHHTLGYPKPLADESKIFLVFSKEQKISLMW